MDSDEVVQLSLDEDLAPNVPVSPEVRARIAGPEWKPIRTPGSTFIWHRVRTVRKGNAVVTVCGFGGHKVAKTSVPFTPCPDCAV